MLFTNIKNMNGYNIKKKNPAVVSKKLKHPTLVRPSIICRHPVHMYMFARRLNNNCHILPSPSPPPPLLSLSFSLNHSQSRYASYTHTHIHTSCALYVSDSTMESNVFSNVVFRVLTIIL